VYADYYFFMQCFDFINFSHIFIVPATRETDYRSGVANQSETKSYISYRVTAKSRIMHMNIAPSLPHSHTYLCLARFIVMHVISCEFW